VDKKERDHNIKQLRTEGWTLAQIARHYGLTKARIHYICAYTASPVAKPMRVSDQKNLAYSDHKLTVLDIKALLAPLPDTALANFFLHCHHFTIKELAERSRRSPDDIEAEISRIEQLSRHLDQISAIQELFS
jgi:hypothetical protein